MSGNWNNNNQLIDENIDGFTDIPLLDQRHLFAKYKAELGNFKQQFAFRYLEEERTGGQLDWNREFLGSDVIYGEFIETKRSEILSQSSWKSWKLDASAAFHQQESYYGDVNFDATQDVYFANLTFNPILGKWRSQFGLTARFNDYQDNSDVNSSQQDFLPGVFAQTQRNIGKRTTILTGARIDHHESHGVVFSPRFNLRHQLSENTAIRLNSGTGFRVVNLVTEDHAFLTGSREVIIKEDLLPEESFNISLNAEHFFPLTRGYIKLEGEGFNTSFSNRIIPDYDQDPNQVIYENLSGNAFTTGLRLNSNFVFPKWNIDLGAMFVENYETDGGQRTWILYSPKWSGNFNAEYSFTKELKV
ncbi:MAG: TonB-dependent receptor, partial [Bacteroidota bacterium]